MNHYSQELDEYGMYMRDEHDAEIDEPQQTVESVAEDKELLDKDE